MNEFLQALSDWMEAKTRLAEGLRTCERDADYFLGSEYRAVENAQFRIECAFDSLVDQRIRDAFNPMP